MSSRTRGGPLDLVPVSGLVRSDLDGHWIATDADPQFEFPVRASFLGQWVHFSFEIRPAAAWTSPPVIYLDCGSGYSEATKLELTTVGLAEHRCELVFFLPSATVRARLDPLAQMGAFSLGMARMERLSRPRAALAMTLAVASKHGWGAVLRRAAIAFDPFHNRSSASTFLQWLVASYRNGEVEPASPGVAQSVLPVTATIPKTATVAAAPERILVHRRNALGDVLLITPILRALRMKYPGAHIAVSTLYPTLFDQNPNVDEVVRSETPLPGFDLTIDLQYELLPDLHIVDAYARIAGVDAIDKTPELFLAHADLVAAESVLLDAGVRQDERFVAFHMESGWKVRDWPLERFRAVAQAICSRGWQVVILGEKATTPLDFGVDLRGRTNLRVLAAVILKCDAMLSIDSGLMHVAAALHRPFVGLFGCTDPEKRVPDWALPSTIYARIVCHGCHHRQRPVPVTSAPICPFESVLCMDELQVGQVADRVLGLLDASFRPAVSIVIPHYRHYPVLERCLASLFRIGASVSFEVIVVDDSGHGGESALISAWAHRVHLVTNATNLGFSRSCNAGVAVAKGEFVVLLNDDTTVTTGWLDELLAAYEGDPRAAIVGPKLLYPDSGAIQHCGTAINEHGVAEHLYRCLPSNFSGANRPRRFRALTGACMLMKRQDFLEVGGLDVDYKNGGEDTDLCFSFLDRGRTLVYCPSSVVFHHEGYSRGLRTLDDADDAFNRERLRHRWSKYLTPDISDYCLLAEIEAAEGQTWRSLEDVPAELRAQYDTPSARSVGRHPFKCEIGSGMNPQPGYIHLDVMRDAPSLDILHDVARQFPFVDGSVGEVLANHVVEHVSWRDLPKLVADLQRIMVPGGKVFIRTPNLRFIAEHFLAGELSPEHPGDEAAMRAGYGSLSPGLWANIKLFSGQDYPSNYHYNCMDPADLGNLFRRCGFSRVELTTFGREFSPGEIQLVAEK